jgi:hypothetical protein
MTKPETNRLWGPKGALATFALALAAGLWTPSCGEADKIYDCQSVCNRYKSCFSSTYDVDGCRSRCKNNADTDMDYQRKADDCEACIDDRSCQSATFSCATRCVGIVP